MTRIRIMTIATTSRIWIKEFIVNPVISPKSQSTMRIVAIVVSMVFF